MAEPCGECGMEVEPAAYHPYAACLMYKGCHRSDIVQANLDGVRAFGAQYDSGFDDMADLNADLKAALRYWLPELNEIDVAAEEYERWKHDRELCFATSDKV